MPTGGESLDKEKASWLKTGACTVGMGSKLISKQLPEEKNYAKIEEFILNAIDIVKSVS
jgi:2-dehydro-3-deoxyphosphogluconate aldolase / (4S)-4-hydroxy-2-oxoglutarate aldolase